MAELADALDSGSSALTGVEVQVLFPALQRDPAGLDPGGVFLRPVPADQTAERPPPAGVVHVWQADPDQPPVAAADLWAVLSAGERERADRMRQRAVADRFTHCRGLLRRLLAGYLGCSPADVPLTVSADGKPEMAGGPFFNLSHTAGRMLVAVAGGPVGVDVDRVRAVPSADDLVRRWFHPAERERFFGLPPTDRPAAFLRGWTCTEALLKGVGCGSRELGGCVVEVDPNAPPAVALSPDGRAWSLACWQADGFAAAVAVRAG